MDLDSQIEAVLFYRAEPVSRENLAKMTGVGLGNISRALIDLQEKLKDRGLCLVEANEEIELGTNPLASDLIEKIAKEELARDLGKAGLETLTLILYQGPISRPDIDNVRGVNSSFILRNLMIRGLIERIVDKKDSRRFLYQSSGALLRHLGLTKISELPDYEVIKNELINFLNQERENKEDTLE